MGGWKRPGRTSLLSSPSHAKPQHCYTQVTESMTAVLPVNSEVLWAHVEVLMTSYCWGALVAPSTTKYHHVSLRPSADHAFNNFFGRDVNIRPSFRINCMLNQIGIEFFFFNKTKAVLQNSYLDPILFSIYANNMEQVAWSSLSFSLIVPFCIL